MRMGKRVGEHIEKFHSKITQKAKELIPLKKITKHPWWDSEFKHEL